MLTEQLAAAQLVVVNLDGVQYLASAGLQALFEANDLATEQGRDLRLVCHSQSADWALAASGLREYFRFAASVPAALTSAQQTRSGAAQLADQLPLAEPA